MVWFSQNIPKYAFIVWLAIQGKLRKWGSYDLMVCSLCSNEMDSHEHLFFKCKYSNEVWTKVLMKINEVQWADIDWKDLIEQFSNLKNSNNIASVVRRLCLATCVYMVWQERNNRIFREEVRNVEVLVQCICDVIKCRLSSLIVKKTRATIDVGKKWDVTFKIQTK